MEVEENINFFITNLESTDDDKEWVLELPEYDSVELLKIEIHSRFDIPPHKQYITGWVNAPESDNCILKGCVANNFANLQIRSTSDPQVTAVLDLEAFLKKSYPSLAGTFYVGDLSSALSNSCRAPLGQRKILLLYLHMKHDPFSKDFLEHLQKPEIRQSLGRRFCLLGWDIQNREYQSALVEALDSNDLQVISRLVESEHSGALFILPVGECISVYACLRSKFSPDDFKCYIENATRALLEEVKEETIEQNRLMENKNSELESQAALNFVNILKHDYPKLVGQFHVGDLSSALSISCYAPLEQRKILILYLHNGNENFSRQFLENLGKPEIQGKLEDKFCFLGWDVLNTDYERALVNALDVNQLDIISKLLESKLSAALFIFPVREAVTVMTCCRSKFSSKDFKDAVDNAKKSLSLEIEQERELDRVLQNQNTENDVDSEGYQRLMADLLGDRDYDSFDFDQHDLLKDKIGFALYGPPKRETGYDEKEKKKINSLFERILESSNDIAEDVDQVTISFIYNCVEPLPAEKLKRAKKYPDYNPKTDLMPLPVFILRKCVGSDNPCRIFIDDTGRTYNSFSDYINDNKLHACVMVLPKGGRYKVNDGGTVLLERHLSPACGVGAKVLQGADIASTVAGLSSGALFLVGTVGTVTFAPAVGIAAAILGVGAGVYGMGRSIHSVIDKAIHKESLSFANSEARGAYFNILAGSLGFVGAGSNLIVSQLVARGFNIGQGAAAVVNTINVANIAGSGISLVNSGYDVYDQWVNENQTPSLLMIVQLSSSVLFFGHAVYSFRTCQTIVDETQASVLKDYQDSLRSNRHRKTFSKLMKETIRQNDGHEVRGRAEVIKTIRNIQNKDEIFAALTRSNKEMTKRGIKFSASEGGISMNGINIDMNEFTSLTKKQTNSFLKNVPTRTDITPTETTFMRDTIMSTFSLNNVSLLDFINYATTLLSACDSNVKEVIINTVAKLLASLAEPVRKALDEIFPSNNKYISVMNMVMDHFGQLADEIEMAFRRWRQSGDPGDYYPFFEHINGKGIQKSKMWLQFFQSGIQFYSNMGRRELCEQAMKKLLEYFYAWFSVKLAEYDEKTTRDQSRRVHSAGSPSRKKPCKVCGGYSFERRK